MRRWTWPMPLTWALPGPISRRTIPEPRPAQRYQHDLHQARCACGRVHVAARPAGVPDAPLSVGPRLSAMAVYLSVFQHVPVERAQLLIADLTGGVVSAGFVHSCLGKAAGLVSGRGAADPHPDRRRPGRGVRRDDAAVRAGRGEEVRPRRVHRAVLRVPPRHPQPGDHEGGRDPAVFAGIVVSDRYQGYYSETWENFAGHQACAAHIIRDFQDCAETYPGAAWPEQAMRSLRGLIHAWHAAREQGLPAIPAGDRGTAGDRVPPRRHRRPGRRPPRPRPEEQREAATRPRAARILPATAAGRRPPVHRRHQRLADEQHQRARRPPPEDPAEDLRPPHQRRRHPGPARHPRLHRHRPQARPRAPTNVLHQLMPGNPWLPPAQPISP